MAYVPAPRALADDFAIIGVANTSQASAEAAAKVCDLPCAFASTSALIASPEVNIVAVTVKVPQHFAIVREAIAAGKKVHHFRV